MSYLAEENIIGSLLIDKNCMDEIYNVLSADMFTSELLGRMYLEFQKGYDNRYDVNPAVIVQKLSGEHFPEYVIIEEIKNKPELAIIMVSHCRAANFTDKALVYDKSSKTLKIVKYSAYDCFSDDFCSSLCL